jgi:hypothetical protein
MMPNHVINGRYLTMSNSWASHPYCTGEVRFNGGKQLLEVSDGNCWHEIQSNNSVMDLTLEVGTIVEWAKKKMQEELEIKEICKQHPGLADIKEQYEIFKVLCRPNKDEVTK